MADLDPAITAREAAARDTTVWCAPWSARGELRYEPGLLAWVLTLLAGAVIGWTVGPWVPLWP